MTTLLVLILVAVLAALFSALVLSFVGGAAYEKAYTLWSNGETEKAVEMLRRLLAKNPDDERSNYLLGRILCLQERFNEAVEFLEAFLAIQRFTFEFPEDKARELLGQAYLKINETESAVKHLEKAWAMNPSETKLAEQLVEILERTGQGKRMIEVLDRWAKHDPRNPEIPFKKAKLLVKVMQYKDADVALKQAVELGASGDEIFLLAGEIQERLGNMKEAVVQYDMIFKNTVTSSSGRAEAGLRLGRILESEGKHNEALDCLQKAMKYEGGKKESGEFSDMYKELLYQMGRVFKSKGSDHDAAVFWGQLYEADPDFRDLPDLVRLAPQKMSNKDLLRGLIHVSTHEFVEMGKKILELLDYTIVETEVVNDQSVNFKVSRDDHGIDREKLVYLRRWETDEVAQLPIQELHLAVMEAEYIGGIFMVNTHFSGSAMMFATSTNMLELIDGTQFANLIKQAWSG